jgi:aryl-alcohol dehydrogenase-like predicted oxidoreductase
VYPAERLDGFLALSSQPRQRRCGWPSRGGGVATGWRLNDNTCHWHHARFDLASGGTFGPFAGDVRTFPVAVVDSMVWVGGPWSLASGTAMAGGARYLLDITMFVGGTAMEYTTLGRTGLQVSRVGFGGGGIGQVWGPSTEEESMRAVHRALDLGINFFDVAPSYGNGKAEEVLGVALRGRRDRVVVATKVRLRVEEMDDVPGAVQRSVEASLRRLRTDAVDVLHVHNRFTLRRGDTPDSLSAEDALGPVLEAYKRVQDAGKTRFIGVSAMEPHVPTIRRIIGSGQYDAVLAYYNLLNWTAQEPPPLGAAIFDNGQIIPLARSQGMGVIGIRSHAAGALTDRVDRPVPPGSLLEQDLASARTLGFLLEGPIRTLSQAAMVFCLMNRDIDTTVPGVKNVAETEEIAGCADLPPIPPHHLERLG